MFDWLKKMTLGLLLGVTAVGGASFISQMQLRWRGPVPASGSLIYVRPDGVLDQAKLGAGVTFQAGTLSVAATMPFVTVLTTASIAADLQDRSYVDILPVERWQVITSNVLVARNGVIQTEGQDWEQVAVVSGSGAAMRIRLKPHAIPDQTEHLSVYVILTRPVELPPQ
jgi:hypothetical protein